MILWAWLVLFGVGATAVRADDLLYSYDGNVLPYEESAKWLVYNACDQWCSESVVNERFVLSSPWETGSFNYHHWMAYPLDAPPLPAPASRAALNSLG